ncbi:MAG: 1-deoxy-D-xylulose-5-phosphate reductoisomerase [Syntrophales bacterium]|nr:1-deoxy-D-xylulose-5-phosphate reductoisomerase [Syntrophales bacterium]
MKKIAILGSTGSIGVNTLNVIKAHPDRFKVVALAAGRNVEVLREQIAVFKPQVVAVADERVARLLSSMVDDVSPAEILWGQDGYVQVGTLPEVDMVVSALVGAIGLVPTISAVEAGKDVALANKESLVIGGSFIMEAAKRRGCKIIPVDSEHSAVFQCLEGQRRENLRKIILTASGGPFRELGIDDLKRVTPQDALRHPNWQMGKKVTVDSATLMNKGLEVIEASWIFAIPVEKIDVVIHPQSIVHSMVEFEDGSVMAQLSVPDMRIPIAYALSYPERIVTGVPYLDFRTLSPLTFMELDFARFPCIKIAYEAARAGGDRPVVMNAANEVAVEAFLEGRIGFTVMPEIISGALDSLVFTKPQTVEDVLEIDRVARDVARGLLKEMEKK